MLEYYRMSYVVWILRTYVPKIKTNNVSKFNIIKNNEQILRKHAF